MQYLGIGLAGTGLILALIGLIIGIRYMRGLMADEGQKKHSGKFGVAGGICMIIGANFFLTNIPMDQFVYFRDTYIEFGWFALAVGTIVFCGLLWCSGSSIWPNWVRRLVE
jgi:hypothetical protein